MAQGDDGHRRDGRANGGQEPRAGVPDQAEAELRGGNQGQRDRDEDEPGLGRAVAPHTLQVQRKEEPRREHRHEAEEAEQVASGQQPRLKMRSGTSGEHATTASIAIRLCNAIRDRRQPHLKKDVDPWTRPGGPPRVAHRPTRHPDARHVLRDGGFL
jgi:hypothetical protein